MGRVLVDSGEGWGHGPARLAIEERLLNVPEETSEIEVDTRAGTSCYYRLKEGERYVVFAGKDRGRFAVGPCSTTFLLNSNQHILDAMRNQIKGGAPRLVGHVLRSSGMYSKEAGVAGARVVAHSEAGRFEAISGSAGAYEIRGMTPGRYQIGVAKPGYVPDDEYNRRWSGRLVLNQKTNTLETDKDAGTVLLGEGSCEVWNVALWPEGRISGTVTSIAGEPLSGVTVQAFAFDEKGKRESRPLRTAKTDARGKYEITPLPGGEYGVGVNAKRYEDEDAYPPTLFGRDAEAPEGARIRVADGAERTGIDLRLPPPRVATTLRVLVWGPNGAPFAGAGVSLKDRAGVQRWYSIQKQTGQDGVLEIPVYVGETYRVVSSAYLGRGRDLRGSADVEIGGKEGNQVVVQLSADR